MNNKWFKIIIALTLTLFISACNHQDCSEECPEGDNHCIDICTPKDCVEGDDWGYPKVWVPAGTSDPSLTLKNGETGVAGHINGQSVNAIDSHQRLLNAGESPLVISIGRWDQWTSWYNGDVNGVNNITQSDADRWDGGKTVPDRECEYHVTNGSSPGYARDDLSPATIIEDTRSDEDTGNVNQYYYVGNGDDRYETIPKGGDASFSNFANTKTPCYFRYGMGLYVGLAPDAGGDSIGKSATQDDVLFAYHIPDSLKPDTPNDSSLSNDKENRANLRELNKANRELDGYLVRGFAKDELPGAQTGDKLFFKIIDYYYGDNDGGYMVKIKEGTRDPSPGPLEYITNMVLDPVFVIMERIYKAIVANESYLNAVRAALVLYIVFYAYQFMIGGVDGALKKGDVVIRILKIAIIVQMISVDSWDFFYNNLFALFIEGTGEIAGLLLSPFSDYDPMQPWYSMDRLLARFVDPASQAKIWSTLFSNSFGFLYIILLWISFAIFIWAVLKAVMIYITAFIGIAIIIVLAPIFIVFILFDKTKKLWEELLGQLMATSVEIIMLFTGLGMFAAVIIMFMERTLGYNVCWNVFADIHLFGSNIHLFDLRFWMPDIGNEMAHLWMDANGDGIREVLPPETAYRYVDLPYFDPYYDQELVTAYMRENNFLEFADLLVFFSAVFVMVSFMSFIPTMSNALKSASSGQSDAASIFPGKALSGALFNSIKETMGNAFNVAESLNEKRYEASKRDNDEKAKRSLGGALGKAVSSGASKATPNAIKQAANKIGGIKSSTRSAYEKSSLYRITHRGDTAEQRKAAQALDAQAGKDGEDNENLLDDSLLEENAAKEATARDNAANKTTAMNPLTDVQEQEIRDEEAAKEKSKEQAEDKKAKAKEELNASALALYTRADALIQSGKNNNDVSAAIAEMERMLLPNNDLDSQNRNLLQGQLVQLKEIRKKNS